MISAKDARQLLKKTSDEFLASIRETTENFVDSGLDIILTDNIQKHHGETHTFRLGHSHIEHIIRSANQELKPSEALRLDKKTCKAIYKVAKRIARKNGYKTKIVHITTSDDVCYMDFTIPKTKKK